MYLHFLCALVGSICLLEVECLHTDTTQLNYNVSTEPLMRAVVTLPASFWKNLVQNPQSDLLIKKNNKKTSSETRVNKAVGCSERKDRTSSKRKLMSEVFIHVDRCSPASLVLQIKLTALIVWFGLIRRLYFCSGCYCLVWHSLVSSTIWTPQVHFRLSFTSLHVKLWSVGFWNRVMSQRDNIQEKVTFYLQKIIQLVTSDHWDLSASSGRK